MKILQALVILLFSSSIVKAEANLLDPIKDAEEYCLAQNIYYESRGSNIADQVAVSLVVINRVFDTRFPATVCGVVKQGRQDTNGNMIRNQCQFSWYCDGKSDVPRDEEAWKKSQEIAMQLYTFGVLIDITEGATHYHAANMKRYPSWSKGFIRTGRIGDHVFYRWE